MKRTLLLLLGGLFFALPTLAQDEELVELLEEVGESYAVEYLRPFVDAFGSDINGGLFHTAKIGGGLIPLLDVYVGVKVVAAAVSEDDQMFDLQYTTTRQISQTIAGQTFSCNADVTFNLTDVPTVFGESDRANIPASTVLASCMQNGVTVAESESFDPIPGLIKTQIAPLPIPQVTIGSFMGTDVTLRYFPNVNIADYGQIEMLGIGVRHSISQYIPLMPVNITVQGMWQKLSIDDPDGSNLLETTAIAGNIAASRSLGPLTAYVGAQVEKTDFSFAYTFTTDSGAPIEVAFDAEAENKFRVLGGVSVALGPIIVNADAARGTQNWIFSGGVGIGL